MEKDNTKVASHVIRIDDERIQDHLGKVVRGSVEETLNALLDAEADRLCNAERYERSEARRDTRAGSYERKLQTRAGEVSLKVPKLRRQTFETAIIERYRRREASVEEALMEMYLAGVSVRRVEDITEALWGTRVSPGTVSNLNKKIYEQIDAWRNKPIAGDHPYVYVDGIVLKRSWAGEVRNVSLLVAIGVNQEGFREILGIVEGAKEDKAGWGAFLKHLKARGLSGVQLVNGDGYREILGICEGAKEDKAGWLGFLKHLKSRGLSGVEETRTVDLHALADSVATDLMELGHDIAVADSGRVPVRCRAAALRRALRNLLENAAVYGGRAMVRVERDDAEVRVVIEDEGPGIPAAATAGVIDSQSVKTTESGGPRGFDAGKKVMGRKRHIVVDTGGRLLGAVVHEADIQDRDGAPSLLAEVGAWFPGVGHIFADGAYAGPKLAGALKKIGDWALEIVRRNDKADGFVALPRRWVRAFRFGFFPLGL